MIMKRYLHIKVRSKTGASESIEFAGVMAMLLILFYLFLMAYPVFITKANVEVFTADLVRKIETTGAIDDTINTYASELADLYGMNPVINYDADFIAGTKKIQIRDSFKVAVETSETIMLLDGTLYEPITLEIPIGDQRVGISEKLWK